MVGDVTEHASIIKKNESDPQSLKKSRVEAFTDAVVAIIMTIMVLEFKTPTSPHWQAILADTPYLLAFTVSFFYVGVAWYNHHYMFALAERITKRVYWWNNAWLFTMAFLPVATAWAGRFITDRGPEYFYLLIYLAWSLAYKGLTRAILHDLDHTNPAKATRVRAMAPYRWIAGWPFVGQMVGTAVLIYFWPPICLLATVAELCYMALHTTPDSDRVEG